MQVISFMNMKGGVGNLSEATDVAESVEYHQPIFLYKRNGKTAREILGITQEFLDRTQGD